MGAFAEWQPQYAAHGVATFPVTIDGKNKKPAVSNYLKIGSRISGQLLLKFPDHDALGFACRLNRITVLDVDTPDERVLADALDRHGPTPFIVRSGSGNFQAWFRHDGERRRVRPDPAMPVDILGDGFCVAPPSRGSKGQYQIIQGCLDDLDQLPRMRRQEGPPAPANDDQAGGAPSQGGTGRRNALQEGDGRNNALFRRLLRAAHSAETKEVLMQTAAQINKEFAAPLPAEEVAKTAASAWRYKEQGRLFVPGGEATAVVFHSDIEHLWDQRDALVLLVRLRMVHGWRNGEPFTLARETADLIGVSYPTYRAARDVLVARHFLEIVHAGGRGKEDPPLARLL